MLRADFEVFCTIWNSSTGATGAMGAAGAGEVVARSAARTPHPTRAGGQDDGSYTNSPKLRMYPIL